jgi:hypothetical protein
VTVSRGAAEYVRALLVESCPGDDVEVTRTFGGLHVEVSGEGSHIRADVSGPDSFVLRLLVAQGKRTGNGGSVMSGQYQVRPVDSGVSGKMPAD